MRSDAHPPLSRAGTGAPIERCQEVYPQVIETCREVARPLGYAIGVHGSQLYDLDLIAAPWSETCASADALAKALQEAINERHEFCAVGRKVGEKPHGRRAYTLTMWGHLHVDLSVMSAWAPMTAILKAADRLAEKAEDITENRRPRMGDLERALAAYGEARDALSTLSVHPSENAQERCPRCGTTLNANEYRCLCGYPRDGKGYSASTQTSTLPPENQSENLAQVIEKVGPSSPEMHTRGNQSTGDSE